MKADEARTELLAQHDRLRAHLEDCARLAQLERTGDLRRGQLDAALTRLREELAAHNEAETLILGKLLHGSSPWGSLLIDRMLEEHLAEHAVFWELLSGSPYDVADRIDDLVAELDEHMAAEERTFLSPIMLRDLRLGERLASRER